MTIGNNTMTIRTLVPGAREPALGKHCRGELHVRHGLRWARRQTVRCMRGKYVQKDRGKHLLLGVSGTYRLGVGQNGLQVRPGVHRVRWRAVQGVRCRDVQGRAGERGVHQLSCEF